MWPGREKPLTENPFLRTKAVRASVCQGFLDIVYDEQLDCARLGFQPEAELFLDSLDRCWSCEVAV